MLDLSKKYRTRSGCPVRSLVRSDFAQLERCPIRGEVFDEGAWRRMTWTADGKTFAWDQEHDWDLVAVPDEAVTSHFEPRRYSWARHRSMLRRTI